MHIKVRRQPQLIKVDNFSFQQLKKQCTSRTSNPSLLNSPPTLSSDHILPKKDSLCHSISPLFQQYLQVNYLNNLMYKISPAVHSKVPLLKQQQNLRDYLMEVQNDTQKKNQMCNQLKYKYFMGRNSRIGGKVNDKGVGKSKESKNNAKTGLSAGKQVHSHKNSHSLIELFDPIEYLEQVQLKKKQKIFSKNIESVTYLSEAPDDSKITELLPSLRTQRPSQSLLKGKNNELQMTHNQISHSICEILQKSIKYQGSQKGQNKRLKHYRSRSELKKANDKKIKNERNHIMNMISRQSPTSHTRRVSAMSLTQIPAKQKYAIDFVSYLRTKTKDQLDKYIYEKLIKKPQKDLQKFQQFILKEVKFQNQENKHKIERFFIKMREEFRRIEKYSKEGSKFDWRTKSMHLDEVKKGDFLLKKTELFEENVIKSTIGLTVPKLSGRKKFKSAREKFQRMKGVKNSHMNDKNDQIQTDNKELEEEIDSQKNDKI